MSPTRSPNPFFSGASRLIFFSISHPCFQNVSKNQGFEFIGPIGQPVQWNRCQRTSKYTFGTPSFIRWGNTEFRFSRLIKEGVPNSEFRDLGPPLLLGGETQISSFPDVKKRGSQIQKLEIWDPLFWKCWPMPDISFEALPRTTNSGKVNAQPTVF